MPRQGTYQVGLSLLVDLHGLLDRIVPSGLNKLHIRSSTVSHHGLRKTLQHTHQHVMSIGQAYKTGGETVCLVVLW